MGSNYVMPELKQLVGAMVFASNGVLTVKEIRRCLKDVADGNDSEAKGFGSVKEKDIREALDSLKRQLQESRVGMHLAEVGGGFRLQSDASCGVWLKHLLEIGKPHRLSRPALETLAIIAYRQPVSKADIESIRGVSVDHVIKMLMEISLVRIVGRSELPGRPFLYGTTQTFLEHFGLSTLDELSNMEPMLAMHPEQREAEARREQAESGDSGAAQSSEPADEDASGNEEEQE